MSCKIPLLQAKIGSKQGFLQWNLLRNSLSNWRQICRRKGEFYILILRYFILQIHCMTTSPRLKTYRNHFSEDCVEPQGIGTVSLSVGIVGVLNLLMPQDFNVLTSCYVVRLWLVSTRQSNRVQLLGSFTLSLLIPSLYTSLPFSFLFIYYYNYYYPFP